MNIVQVMACAGSPSSS